MVINKGGISAIIATVLIILITLAAVAIVWVTIVPVIKDNVLSVGEEARVSIVVDQGYTIFDTGRQVASVQIKRGTDDAELARLNIVFEINGTSEVFKTKGAPNTNEAKIYWFNFSNYTDLVGKVPQYVSVVPVYLRNNQEVVGDVADRVEIPLRSISLSDDDLTAIFSDDGNTVFRKDEAIPVTECKSKTDCGVDGFVGSKFCNVSNNNVYQNYTTYTCSSGSCLSSTSSRLNETCSNGCTSGVCNSAPVVLGPMAIYSCDVSGQPNQINQSNIVYILQNNVLSNNTCFTIMYDNVTLDGNGHSLTYNNISANNHYGISMVGARTNITIKNFYTGRIHDGGGSGSNNYAIYASSSLSDSSITNNYFENGMSGWIKSTTIVIMGSSSNNQITGNYIYSSAGEGINFVSVATGNNISNNYITASGIGIRFANTAYDNVISGNTRIGSGIKFVGNSAGNTISRNSQVGGIDVIEYNGGSFNDNISNNDIIGQYAIYYSSSNPNTGNTIANNNLSGIYSGILFSSSNSTGNRYLNNNITSNGDGIKFGSVSSGDLISGNNITAKIQGLLYMGNSSGDIISGNRITSQNHIGIAFAGYSSNNVINGSNIIRSGALSCTDTYFNCSGIVFTLLNSNSTNDLISGNIITAYGHGIYFTRRYVGTPFSGVANSIGYGFGGAGYYNVSLSGGPYL